MTAAPGDPTRRQAPDGPSARPGAGYKYLWEKHFRGLDLSHADCRVAWMLSTYADGEGRGAHPGTARLVADTGCHKSTVLTAMTALRKAGMIAPDDDPPARERRPATRGPLADAYRLTLPHAPGDQCPHCNWSGEPTSSDRRFWSGEPTSNGENWSAHPTSSDSNTGRLIRPVAGETGRIRPAKLVGSSDHTKPVTRPGLKRGKEAARASARSVIADDPKTSPTGKDKPSSTAGPVGADVKAPPPSPPPESGMTTTEGNTTMDDQLTLDGAPAPARKRGKRPTTAEEAALNGRAGKITDAWAATQAAGLVSTGRRASVHRLVKPVLAAGQFGEEAVQAALLRLADRGAAPTAAALGRELTKPNANGHGRPAANGHQPYRNPDDQSVYDQGFGRG